MGTVNVLKERAAAWDEEHIRRDSHPQTDQRQLLGYFSQFNIKTNDNFS
jgi:hypothetical protein